MERSPVIVAAEARTALGDTLDESWRALRAGRSGIAAVERFGTTGYVSAVAALIEGLELSGRARSLVGPLLSPLLGRIARNFELPADTLLYTATTKAGIDLMERRLRDKSVAEEELFFAHWLLEVKKELGFAQNAGGLNISAACASSTVALARAAAAIASGRAGAALVIGFDLITEFVFSGFSALKALSPAACRPFDRARDGLTLGEGAAALLVMDAGRAAREGRKVLGRVTGWGIANDATHVTAPARDGCGLIKASSIALKGAALEPGRVGALYAHGTATPYNDAMELTAFSGLYPDGGAPPLVATKGATGHTMGAAGALEAALALKMLEERVLPATVGLDNPEERAEGWVATAETELERPAILTTNSGFGGVNAALVLEGTG